MSGPDAIVVPDVEADTVTVVGGTEWVVAGVAADTGWRMAPGDGRWFVPEEEVVETPPGEETKSGVRGRDTVGPVVSERATDVPWVPVVSETVETSETAEEEEEEEGRERALDSRQTPPKSHRKGRPDTSGPDPESPEISRDVRVKTDGAVARVALGPVEVDVWRLPLRRLPTQPLEETQ